MDRPDTSIQKSLRPLRFFCAVLLSVFGIFSSSMAQGPMAQVSVGQGVYTILGDVQSPGTYSWPAGQRVSLQMVLDRARALGPSGIATIRKASQPERTNSVDVRSTSANSTLLSSRDTIVWQSVAGPNLESGNIVFLTDNGPLLQAMTISGVDLSTVLQVAGLPIDQNVIAYRSQWVVQQSLRLDLRSLVQHGDVLDVRTSSRATGIVPVSSPSGAVFQGATQSTSQTVSTPGGYRAETQNGSPVQNEAGRENVAGQNGNSFQVPPIPQAGAGLQIPEFQDFSMIANGANDVPPSPLAGAAEPLQILDSQTEIPSESNDGIFYEVETSGDVASASADTNPASEATLDELADEILQPAVAEKESFAFMNGIFLFGLVLAIGLITIGIVRTRQEQRLHDSMRVGTESGLGSGSVETGSRYEATGLASIDISGREIDENSSIEDVLPSESFTRLPVFSDDSSSEPPELVPFFNSAETATEVETEVSQSLDDVELDDCPVLSAGLDAVTPLEELTVKPSDKDSALEESAVVSFQQPIHEEQFAEPPLDAEPTVSLNEVEEPAVDSADSSQTLDVRTWLSDDTLEQEAESETELVCIDEVSEAAGEETVVDDSSVEESCQDESTIQAVEADIRSEEIPAMEVAASVVEAEADSLQVELTSDDDAEEPVLELPDVDSIRQTLTWNAASDIQVPQNLLDNKEATTPYAVSADCSETAAVEEIAAEEIVVEETAEGETVQETHAARIASSFETPDIPQTSQNQDQNMAQPSMTKAEADYLEDLIQNRLPMELSDAQLPLKISLFGKPEGPRRLRIDAAHTTIAPPHMAKAAGRSKRREPQMAIATETPRQQESAQSAGNQPIEKQAATEISSSVQRTDSVTDSKDQRPASPRSQGPASGLDKALNFLEEQSKS